VFQVACDGCLVTLTCVSFKTRGRSPTVSPPSRQLNWFIHAWTCSTVGGIASDFHLSIEDGPLLVFQGGSKISVSQDLDHFCWSKKKTVKVCLC
jgi:hypothetical protein